MFEAKKLRHDLWIFKIKDKFADKIAKAEYVKKNRDFWLYQDITYNRL